MPINTEEFIVWLKNKELSQRTIENYIYYLPKLFEFNSEITQNSVNQYLFRYKGNIARHSLKNYLKFQVDNKKEIRFKDIDIPKPTGRKESKEIDYINEEQLFKLENALRDEKHKLMLLISFYSGIRLQSLLKLTSDDIDWVTWNYDTERPINIVLKKAKGNKTYTTMVPSNIAQRLKKYIQYLIKVYGKDFTSSSPIFMKVKKGWYKALKETAKNQLHRNIHPHTLRHSCANYWLSRNVVIEKVKEILGHASIVSTQVYVHPNLEDIKDSIMKAQNTNYIPNENTNHKGNSSPFINESLINIAPYSPKEKEDKENKDSSIGTEGVKETQRTNDFKVATAESLPLVVNKTDDKKDNEIKSLQTQYSEPIHIIQTEESPIEEPDDKNKYAYDIGDDSEFDVIIESYEQQKEN